VNDSPPNIIWRFKLLGGILPEVYENQMKFLQLADYGDRAG
jgi:hypothetical protein